MQPIAYEAASELERWIEETPALGLLGVAAKLRYQADMKELAAGIVVDFDQLATIAEHAAGIASLPAGGAA